MLGPRARARGIDIQKHSVQRIQCSDYFTAYWEVGDKKQFSRDSVQSPDINLDEVGDLEWAAPENPRKI